MKYDKANAKVVMFSDNELFMFTSAEIQKRIDNCEAWGCGGFQVTNLETGLFTCTTFDKNVCDIYDKQNSNWGHRIFYID